MRRLRFLFILAVLCAGFPAAATAPALGEAGAGRPPALPRPEHPRPDFERADWLNLNGEWDFRYDPGNAGLGQAWFEQGAGQYDQKIVVPFPWQSRLSGQDNPTYRGVAWYRRAFTLPAAWQGRRVFIRFGAVDYFSAVWVNGRRLGEHEGGYSPFEMDATPALTAGENVLVVRVDDPADLREIPHGKQKSVPPDPWADVDFTASSGIWQTVWLEARPDNAIVSAHITPNVAGRQARLVVELSAGRSASSTLSVQVRSPGGAVLAAQAPVSLAAGQRSGISITIAIPDPQVWDIDSPNLYSVTLQLAAPGGLTDTVRTYFGMRTVESRAGQVWLNGRPIYLMTALDQGFWPDGIYTAPSDDALRADVAFARRIGLNGLRLHLKIEDPRFAYWADHLGLLLWCDTPSPVSFTPLAQQRLKRDLFDMIDRDYNHPSVVIWSPYNETWGLEFRLDTNEAMQRWVSRLYDDIKAADPTRLVVDNSGWSHVRTDIADFHYYTGSPAEWRGINTILEKTPGEATVLGHSFYANGYRYQGEPLMMSEYGSGWRDDRSWDLRWQTNELRRHAGIVGYTYTELYDIEHEYAGYALYDRTPKDFGYDLAAINSPDFVVLDYRGSQVVAPGQELSIPALFSSYSARPMAGGTLHWTLARVLPDAAAEEALAEGAQPIQPQPYTVTPLGALRFSVPDTRGPVQLRVTVTDGEGKVRAANSLDFQVGRDRLPAVETQTRGGEAVYTLRAQPGDYGKFQWDEGGMLSGATVEGRPAAVWGLGHGYVEYTFALPQPWPGQLKRLTIQAELSSRPRESFMSVAGPGQAGTVDISLNGMAVETAPLAALGQNARGALTRINKLGAGEHGGWIEMDLPPGVLEAVESSAAAQGSLVLRLAVPDQPANPGGLMIFGQYAGRYGVPPTLTLVAAAPAPAPAGGIGAAGWALLALAVAAVLILLRSQLP